MGNILVFIIIAAAVVYVGLRIKRTISGKAGCGCGSDCGCKKDDCSQ